VNQSKKSLKQRSINSGIWVLSGRITSQILRLVSNLILTRLLMPEMFGVMAIVTVFMMGISMFSDVGLQKNIVQSKRAEEKLYIDTAWTIQIIRGFIIFGIAIIVSFFLHYLGQNSTVLTGSVYADHQLPFLLAMVSITAIISGFNSINLLILNRRLIIGRAVMIDLISQICGLIFTVLAAWYWREIWTLVLGSIISATIKMLLSHHGSLGEKNQIKWDKASVSEIINFGKWIFLSSILGFLLAQGDRILLGFWISPEMLGIYTIAFFLATAFKGILQQIISSVFYPILSEIVRDNPSQLKHVYYRIRAKIDLLVMIIAGFMASGGEFIINFLYDDRYSEAGWMLQVLSVSIVFLGYSLAGVCLMARGDAKSNMILTLVATMFLYISVPFAYFYYGLYGAIIAIALNYIVDIPSTFYMMRKIHLLDIKKEFRMLPFLFIAYGIGEYAQSLFM